jgi:Co/Zn/Cd efflux system component
VGLWFDRLPKALILGIPASKSWESSSFALAAKLVSVLPLMRYRDDDASSLCLAVYFRNDAIGNVIVIFAAFGVWGSMRAWPNLAATAVMTFIFLSSSMGGRRHRR